MEVDPERLEKASRDSAAMEMEEEEEEEEEQGWEGKYEELEVFVPKLLKMTRKAVRDGEEASAMRALTCWIDVMDQEIDVEEEDESGCARSRSRGYVRKHADELMKLILPSLTRQIEGNDEIYCSAQAAASSLHSLSSLVADDIIPMIQPFIQENLQAKHWRFREAAAMAVGAILPGISKEKSSSIVGGKVQVIILDRLTDGHPLVRNTASWTLSKICEHIPESITSENMIPGLVEKLRCGVNGDAKDAVFMCTAIHHLVENLGVRPLSNHYGTLLQALFEASERPEEDVHRAACEAIGVLVNDTPEEFHPIVQSILPVVLSRLASLMDNKEPTTTEISLLESLLPILGHIVSLMGPRVARFVPTVMELCIKAFQMSFHEIHIEAVIVVERVSRGRIAFTPFMDPVLDFVVHHLKSRAKEAKSKVLRKYKRYLLQDLGKLAMLHGEIIEVLRDTHSRCFGMVVGLVGDISRAVESRITPRSTELVEVLVDTFDMACLKNKGQILQGLGDLALATNGHFERHLPPVMKLLERARVICEGQDDEKLDGQKTLDEKNDKEGEVGDLTISSIECYVSVLQALADDGKERLFIPHLDQVRQWLRLVANKSFCKYHQSLRKEAMKCSAGLIGDLGRCLGNRAFVKEDNAAYSQIVADISKFDHSEEAIRARDYAQQYLKEFLPSYKE